jgi:hypothetical protein
MTDFKPLTKVDMEDLLEGIEKCKGIRFSAKDVVTLERKGYVVIYAGDPMMNKMKTYLTQFYVNQVDIETWTIQRKDYILTDNDKKVIMSSCKYNGNIK